METALLVAIGLLVGLGIAAFGLFVARPDRAGGPVRSTAAEKQAAERLAADQAEQRIIELGARVQQMGELLAKAQAQLQHASTSGSTRSPSASAVSMQTTTQHTVENLQKLQRAARGHRQRAEEPHRPDLAGDLAARACSPTSRRAARSARAAWRRSSRTACRRGSYEFQYTLQNGKRPDCVIFLPDQRPLVIDAKFPLEAVTAFRDAKTDDERK